MQSVQQEAPTSYRLSGEVRGTNGDPLVGANVIIQGTTGGTTTNLQGAFTLMVSAKDVLEISSLGYTSQQIAVYGKTALSVTLN
ncbi:MAG: carboxypeptidase-like regulatory domain-containing protein, partial [Mucinivorans sp.]